MATVYLPLGLLLALCGGLSAVSTYKDTRLKFVSHEALNKHDKTEYTDCHHLRHTGGYNVSGVYTLHLNSSWPYPVHCEHTADISYTVIQRRSDGSVHFQRKFNEYYYGFGYPQSDYWMGLITMYHLTNAGNNVLTINMQTWDGQARNARYSMFKLLDPTNFVLHIGGFSGQVPDDLGFNNGMPFATSDRPDRNLCAVYQKAGWWYNYCTYALPTGNYYYGRYQPTGGYYDGIYWKDWTGYDYSLKFFSMSLSRQ
ncbi:angiopoietin-related protein 1-like [Haliotis rufescens]|uniref:angiopoietin-related protein 1-like n=1 Tax=Haliotis rufescens TaxID=6454 RepID=UPI001EB08169|nr:angiopoietin-related protein 1-like [Haliotis rufescens]